MVRYCGTQSVQVEYRTKHAQMRLAIAFPLPINAPELNACMHFLNTV